MTWFRLLGSEVLGAVFGLWTGWFVCRAVWCEGYITKFVKMPLMDVVESGSSIVTPLLDLSQKLHYSLLNTDDTILLHI